MKKKFCGGCDYFQGPTKYETGFEKSMNPFGMCIFEGNKNKGNDPRKVGMPMKRKSDKACKYWRDIPAEPIKKSNKLESVGG